MSKEEQAAYEKGQADLLEVLEPVITGVITLKELAPTLQEMLDKKQHIV